MGCSASPCALLHDTLPRALNDSNRSSSRSRDGQSSRLVGRTMRWLCSDWMLSGRLFAGKNVTRRLSKGALAFLPLQGRSKLHARLAVTCQMPSFRRYQNGLWG